MKQLSVLLLIIILLTSCSSAETWILPDLDIGPCHVRVEADPLSEELIEVRVTRISDNLGPLPLGFSIYTGADAVGTVWQTEDAWLGYAECHTDTLTIVPFYDGYEDPTGAGIITGLMAGMNRVSHWEVYAQRGTFMIEGSAKISEGICSLMVYSGCSRLEPDPIVSWDVYINGEYAWLTETTTLDDRGRWTDRRLAQASIPCETVTSIRIVPVLASGSCQVKLGADFYNID